MAKVDKGTKTGRSAVSGQFVDGKKEGHGKTDAGSTLNQHNSKVSATSSHVLKSVSSAHSDALKRLKDR